jgi:bacteriorhodopsin
MTKQGAHPSGMETFQPDPRPAISTQLQASFWLWLLAVTAGLFETVLVVVDATDGEVGSAAQVAVGVAVRLLVFTAAVYLAIQLRLGMTTCR